MLTLRESRPLLKYLRFWSTVNVFPFTVNVSSGKLVEFLRWKTLLWRILYLLAVLHCIYGLLNVIYMLFLRQDDVVLYHLPVQFDGVLAPSILLAPIATALISNVQIVAKLFNELYSGCRHSSCRHWMKLNITELTALIVGFAMIGAIIFYMALICIESSMSHLLTNISLLTSYRDNIGVLTLTYCLELYSFSLLTVNSGFLISLNALVIAKVQEDLNGVLTNLRRCESIDGIEVALKTSRKVQLYLQLFNIVNAWFLHAYKTTSILAAITHGYFGVRFKKNLVLTAFCGCIHVAVMVVFCVTFQRAYKLVLGQLRVRRELAAASRRVIDGNTRRKLLLAVKSLRRIGLKVGHFHEIQRNSSVIFVDFVERQLVRFLVAF